MLVTQIDHDRNLGRVPVMFVVSGKLEMPVQLSGVRIDSQQSIAVQIVASATLTTV